MAGLAVLQQLLVLALVLLQLKLNQAAEKCIFPSAYVRSSQMVQFNTTRHRVRSWHTRILGQYSPHSRQLVLVFVTPECNESVGQFRVRLAACGRPGPDRIVKRSDSRSVHGLPGANVTLITIDIAGAESLSEKEFGLCLQLWTFADGRLVTARALSPLVAGCHVSLAPRVSDTAGTADARDLLPAALADHLWRLHRLAAKADCCLSYAGGYGATAASGGGAAGKAVSAELIALCYIGGVVALCAMLACAYCCLTTATRAAHKTPPLLPPPCLLWCQEFCLRRQIREWNRQQSQQPQLLQHQQQPTLEHLYSMPDLCGPPYLHLLTHCRSVDTSQPIAAIPDGMPLIPAVV